LITLILSNRLDNITLSSHAKRLLNPTIGAFILVFFLPRFSFFQPDILTSLELMDDILAAPFLFSCLGRHNRRLCDSPGAHPKRRMRGCTG